MSPFSNFTIRPRKILGQSVVTEKCEHFLFFLKCNYSSMYPTNCDNLFELPNVPSFRPTWVVLLIFKKKTLPGNRQPYRILKSQIFKCSMFQTNLFPSKSYLLQTIPFLLPCSVIEIQNLKSVPWTRQYIIPKKAWCYRVPDPKVTRLITLA